jgi:hypothetical protein
VAVPWSSVWSSVSVAVAHAQSAADHGPDGGAGLGVAVRVADAGSVVSAGVSELGTGVDDDVGSGFGVTSRSATGLEADVGVGVCCAANMGGNVPMVG